MSVSLEVAGGRAAFTPYEDSCGYHFTEHELEFALREAAYIPPTDTALPDGTLFVEHRYPFVIAVHQQRPQVRLTRWSDYTDRRLGLSVPYAVLFVAYYKSEAKPRGVFRNFAQLYFSNHPITSKKDRTLCYPPLLNVADRGPTQDAWVCVSRCKADPDWVKDFGQLPEYVWSSTFNYDAEFHSGSWYTQYGKHGYAEGVFPATEWHENTKADPRFGLRVNWKPCPRSVGEVIDAMFKLYSGREGSPLGRLLRLAQEWRLGRG